MPCGAPRRGGGKSHVKVKVCGITNAGDAREAVRCGTDALGFIFAKESPRYVSREVARAIIGDLPPFVTPVGVVVNQSRESIAKLITETGIRCIQFHGDEVPADLNGYSIPVYKVFRVGNGFEPEGVKRYPGIAYHLDAYAGDIRGGTGTGFDWSIARRVSRYGRVILSGGIGPDNVVDAIQQVHPYAVDVNSAVESSPGKKDSQRLRALFHTLRTFH